MSNSLLDVNGVDASYGDFQVLTDITFSVGRADTVAYLGRDGTGKTTTFKVIIGLLPGRGTRPPPR